MHIRHLSVVDFRSWPAAELDLDAGATALIGPNGEGKTNLLEAIGYLATLGSHRAAADAALVRAGAERGVVRAAVVAGGRELRPEIEIVPGKANRARLGATALPRTRELLGVVRTVLFAPEDLAIVRGDPGERRRFLDDLLVSRRPRLAGVRADYERVLRQRAALLKSAGARRGAGAELPTLDVWDGHLAQHGAELLRARLATVRELHPFVAEAHAQVAPESAPLTLTYLSQTPAAAPPRGPAGPEGGGSAGLAAGDDLPSVERLRDSLLEQLVRVRAAELERGVNLVGPHRDDLELRLGELPVRGYASQGEAWSVALALRLGSYELLRADDVPGGDPVLLLDDVFAQLDGQRRDQIARVAAKAEQAIVTAAVGGDVPPELAGVRFVVAGGQVRRAE